MIKHYLAAIALALASVSGFAQQQATPVNGDTRLVTFEYDADQTYLVLTRPKSVTHIQLRPEERVTTAVAGDTSNFTMVISANRNNILIRPKYENLSTSVTLITNERNYPIMLRSTAEATGKWYQRVTWNFHDLVVEDIAAQDAQASKARATATEATDPIGPTGNNMVSLDRMSFNYGVEGDAEFRPLQVFDDGIRTYVRFPDNLQNIPAIFSLVDGDAKILNFNVEEKYVVIQGVVPALMLKMGKAEVKVTKATSKRRVAPFSEISGG